MWAFPFVSCVGAGNGIRTRDIQLGRLTLYQLSYSRGLLVFCPEVGGGRRIRTFEGVSRQIYSLLPLAARASLLGVSSVSSKLCPLCLRATLFDHARGDSRLPLDPHAFCIRTTTRSVPATSSCIR